MFEAVFGLYNRWLFRRRFHDVHVKGLEHLTQNQHLYPQVVCVNHSSWWDGLVAYLLSRHACLDGYCMMEEKQLARLKPFTWIGAFSVVRERPREAFQSFRYAVNLLKAKPGRTVWIFPQGEILPNDSRPLRFFRGFAKIAEESAPCAVLPMAIRYEFLGSYKPDILVSIGAPTVINVSERLSDAFAFEVESLLAGIAEDLLTDGCSTYTKLLRG